MEITSTTWSGRDEACRLELGVDAPGTGSGLTEPVVAAPVQAPRVEPGYDARVLDLLRIMAKVAERDFSEKPPVVEAEDGLSLLGLGFRFMIEDLERATGELDREREELRHANERLQTLDAAKTRFINTAAHELGTPLTPMVLQLWMLRDGSHGPLTASQQAALEMLDRNMERLASLVKDLLEVARLQSQHLKIHPVPCELTGLANQVIESYEVQAGVQGVRIALDAAAPVTVEADPNRVTQVLYNLVSNALKFTPPGGQVQVRIDGQADGALVSVVDTGAGMEPQHIERLFQPFGQLAEPVIPGRGTGLGLFISKGIIELHGGRIGCSSPGLGRGSEFYFFLPSRAAGPSASLGNGA